jgi:hypothetical protein
MTVFFCSACALLFVSDLFDLSFLFVGEQVDGGFISLLAI